jgi:hypothetical protein
LKERYCPEGLAALPLRTVASRSRNDKFDKDGPTNKRCRDSGIRWLSDPSDLNLALRELPKAHAQKRNVGSLTARRSRQGFFLSFSDRRFTCIG